MLMRFDPFRELDWLTQRALGNSGGGASLAMDAYRQGDRFLAHFDLPGINPEDVELTVEKNVLTVRAERKASRQEGQQWLADERPRGTFTRQLFLGEALDADHAEASYEHGVLTVTIPVAEAAKPRKVEITNGGGPKAIEATAA